jgi:AraC family transcriptional activator of pobA
MSLVNVPPGAVHAFAFEPGTQGWVVTLSDDLIVQLLGPAGEVRRTLADCGVLTATRALAALMTQLTAEFEGSAPARALVLQGLCAVLLGQAARTAARAAPPPRDSPGSALQRRFDTLLETRLMQHRTVADCAAALAVTPTHLSRVLRQATGQPASRLIEARLMREARRQLAYTSLQVASIAYTLGFADPAHFSRVFSRVEGLSPRAFRERLEAGRRI